MRGLLGLAPSSAHAAAWNTLDTLAALLAQCLAHAKCRADLEVRVSQQVSRRGHETAVQLALDVWGVPVYRHVGFYGLGSDKSTTRRYISV